jgi:hypothetical protein
LNKGVSRWFHYTDILWCTVNKTLIFLHTYIFLTEAYLRPFNFNTFIATTVKCLQAPLNC